MRYYVTYRIDARYIAKVDADSLEDALELADDMVIEADFGEAEDIDSRRVIAEDENGNYVWEVL